jgi:glycosyltransferase involved in cell wall biosynthesis
MNNQRCARKHRWVRKNRTFSACSGTTLRSIYATREKIMFLVEVPAKKAFLPMGEENVASSPERQDLAGSRVPRSTLPSVCLSIVIPVYNEHKTLAEILRRVRAVPIAKEIILVDDASTDGTRDLLRSMEGDQDLRILYQPANRGKGAALKAGFLKATGDIVIIQDADLEYDPADYERLIQPILMNRADVVYGSRFLAHESHRVLSFWHALGNRLLTTLSNVFTNLHLTDMETCYKVFRRETIQAIAPRLKENRFGIEPELTAKVARGMYRVSEVAISFKARTFKEGKKIGWRDGLKALWCIVRYWKWD